MLNMTEFAAKLSSFEQLSREAVGGEVEVFGSGCPEVKDRANAGESQKALDELAELAGTIPYDIMTRVGAQIPIKAYV